MKDLKYQILNQTVDLWEMLMFQIGSTWTLDSLYIYLNTSIGLLGAILNSLSLFVLFRIKENQAFYKYMKLYTFNGICVCLLVFAYSFSRSPRYLSFGFSLGSSIIRCYLSNSIFFMVQFANSINICVLLERISNFVPKLVNYFKNKVYKVSFNFLLISIALNMPSYFVYEMRSEADFKEALNNSKKLLIFTFCKRSSFAISIYGRVFVFFLAFIKDFLYLIIEIILTLLSLVYLRKFFKKKHFLLHQSFQISLMSQKMQVILNDYDQPNKTLKSINKSNKAITNMSLVLTSLSIMANISSLIGVIIFILFSNGILYHDFTFLLIFTAAFKHVSNFFILFFFNKNFRKFFHKLKIAK
jgi:hypothetical protein